MRTSIRHYKTVNNLKIRLIEQYLFIAIKEIIDKYSLPLKVAEDFTTFDISAPTEELLTVNMQFLANQCEEAVKALIKCHGGKIVLEYWDDEKKGLIAIR